MRFLLFCAVLLTACDQDRRHPLLYNVAAHYAFDEIGMQLQGTTQHENWLITDQGDHYELQIISEFHNQNVMGRKQADKISFHKASVVPCGAFTIFSAVVKIDEKDLAGSYLNWVGFCGGGGLRSEVELKGRQAEDYKHFDPADESTWGELKPDQTAEEILKELDAKIVDGHLVPNNPSK